MAFKVVTTAPRAGYAFQHEREALDPINAEIVVVPNENPSQFSDADALMMGPGMNVTADLIRGLRQCKAIVNGGVGVDRIDVEAATEANIPVVNVPDVWLNEVADHAMMLLLASIRKLVYANEITSSGGWAQVYEKLRPVPRIQGKTLGLVAFGNIARNVAKRAQAFGMRVVAFDPLVSPDVMAQHGVESRSLEDLLRESDFVSAHAPHNRHTHHMLSDAQFALMKPSAIFIDTGRGRVVDEHGPDSGATAGQDRRRRPRRDRGGAGRPEQPVADDGERDPDAAHGILLGRGVHREQDPRRPGDRGHPERPAPPQLRQPGGVRGPVAQVGGAIALCSAGGRPHNNSAMRSQVLPDRQWRTVVRHMGSK